MLEVQLSDLEARSQAAAAGPHVKFVERADEDARRAGSHVAKPSFKRRFHQRSHASRSAVMGVGLTNASGSADPTNSDTRGSSRRSGAERGEQEE